MAVAVTALEAVPLLEGLGPDALAPLAERLAPIELAPGEPLYRQGDPAAAFSLVVEGELEVSRDDGSGPSRVAVVGPGSVVGELALLRDRARMATVEARGPVSLLQGDAEAFECLLHVPGLDARLRELVRRRLAEDQTPVTVTAADGTELAFRPLVAADRAALVAGIDAMSSESLHRRFFSGGKPSPAVVDHLLDVDYVDHFAWVAGPLRPDGSVQGVATARFVRRSDDPTQAEAAFTVADDQQGRGIGTLLLGVLAVAAGIAGLDRLYAEVQRDNRPMRAVLDKAGASWTSLEPGVVATTVDVATARALLDDETAARVAGAVRETITAGGLALARPVDEG